MHLSPSLQRVLVHVVLVKVKYALTITALCISDRYYMVVSRPYRKICFPGTQSAYSCLCLFVSTSVIHVIAMDKYQGNVKCS